MSNVIGEQYLVALKREKEYTFSLIVSSIVNVILNIPFIIMWGALGAIISSIISETIKLVIGLFVIRKEFDLKKVLLMSRNYVVSGLLMFIIVKLISNLLVSSIINTFILFIVGVIVYIGMLFVLKDNLLLNIISKSTNECS